MVKPPLKIRSWVKNHKFKVKEGVHPFLFLFGGTMFCEWDSYILKDVKLEMMKTAALISDDELILKSLAELIDSHSDSFVNQHKMLRLSREHITSYAKMIFVDINNELAGFIKDEWEKMSVGEKLVMYFPFKLAERKIFRLIKVAEIAIRFY